MAFDTASASCSSVRFSYMDTIVGRSSLCPNDQSSSSVEVSSASWSTLRRVLAMAASTFARGVAEPFFPSAFWSLRSTPPSLPPVLRAAGGYLNRETAADQTPEKWRRDQQPTVEDEQKYLQPVEAALAQSDRRQRRLSARVWNAHPSCHHDGSDEDEPHDPPDGFSCRSGSSLVACPRRETIRPLETASQRRRARGRAR